MKKKEQDDASSPNSLRTLKLFCLIVGGVIITSLVYRIWVLVQHSKFDGTSGFIVSYSQTDQKKTVFYAFDPPEETITQLLVTSDKPIAHPGKILGIPADASLTKRVIHEEQGLPIETTSYAVYSPKASSDMSLIDSIRLWWLFRSTPQSKITKLSLTLPQEETTLDTKTSSLFIDSKLDREKQSVAIVNGTSISGLGRRLERMLSQIGVEVISITTAHQSVPHSRIIYYGEKTYTVERLSRILPFPVKQKQGNNLSDIVIELGEDTKRIEAF